MPENESILYRGANYELGHGPGFYGIWPAGSPRPPSIEWWPDTPDGWQGAWARYNALETPGSITMVSEPRPARGRWGAGRVGTRALLASGLLAVGIICGLAGLFPAYLSGASLTSSASQLIPHVFYLAGWAASLALILLGGSRLKVGVLFSLGLSVVTFGFFFSDLGEVIAAGSHLAGAGLVLSLIGWVACAAGSVVALPLQAGFFRRSAAQLRSTFSLVPAAPAAPADADTTLATPPGSYGQPVPAGSYGAHPGYGAYQPQPSSRGQDPAAHRAILTVAIAALAALGAAITFAPSWDSYTLRTATGVAHTLTAGNAFSNPAAVIVGDVAVMVALVLVAVTATLWRPLRLGAALLAGAVIPMIGQGISALAQLGEATSPAQFGISSAQANQLGLTISQGVTPVFWFYCAFVVILAVLCGWLYRKPRQSAPAVATAPVSSYS